MKCFNWNIQGVVFFWNVKSYFGDQAKYSFFRFDYSWEYKEQVGNNVLGKQ